MHSSGSCKRHGAYSFTRMSSFRLRICARWLCSQHTRKFSSQGELTLWHLPTLIRVHVWQLPSPVLDMALVPSSTSPHRLLLLYRVPCSQSSPQQPSPLVLQVSELLCADPFDKPLYRYKSTLFVRLIRGMLDQVEWTYAIIFRCCTFSVYLTRS